ncbi:MAG: aspartate kinase [Alphaproteobacteria bacterium]|nr:aspartate kinase [Alphaproteobacteria bacterium]
MSCIVQKFGGTSVATLERIRHVADITAQTRQKGHQVVAVVSAMAGVTNKFIEYAHNLNAYEGEPEYDSVVSSGELVTSGLLAIALKNLGLNARSYTSWQVPIRTDDNYGQATIRSVDSSNLRHDIQSGTIPVVAGFQGISSQNKITTLGRGGSDLTAVAVASALNAELCEIYSDVDGVYTIDPNLYADAKKIDEISACEMLTMAAQGAKVLQEQSVNYAMQKGVTIRVASSFLDNGGTIISGKVKTKKFTGLAAARSLSPITMQCKFGTDIAKVSALLERYFIKVETYKSLSSSKLLIMIDKDKVTAAVNILSGCDLVENVKQEVSRKRLARISVIGNTATNEIAEKLAETLHNANVSVLEKSIINYGINFIIPSDKLQIAVAKLHQYCGLGL